jgi:hypothetical protein
MSSLEQQLRRLKNETLDEIRHHEKAIAHCQDVISRLKTSKQAYNPRVVIERNEAEIDRFEKELITLNKRIDEIESGSYEEKLRAEMEANKQTIQQKTKATQKRKADAAITEVKAKKVVPGSKPPKSEPFRHFQRNNPRDFDYAEKQYLRDCASIPDHLREKLKNMPNNLGYVWKDIWAFGDKQARNYNEITLYEKRHQQFLMHVYDTQRRMYYLYDKDNTGHKKLLEKRPY